MISGICFASTFTVKPFQAAFLGNVSAIMDHFIFFYFWMEEANKLTHLIFMSCKSDRFSSPSHTRSYYSDFSTTTSHVTLMVLDWMLLCNRCRRHGETAAHAIALTRQTRLHIVFCHVGSYDTEVIWFPLVIGCCFFLWHPVCGHAWLPGVPYCMWQYVQAISLSTVPCLSTTGTKRHKLHYYLCNNRKCVP